VPLVQEQDLVAAVDQIRDRERRIMNWVRGEKFSLDDFHGLVE
jgi:hypothetical protein